MEQSETRDALLDVPCVLISKSERFPNLWQVFVLGKVVKRHVGDLIVMENYNG